MFRIQRTEIGTETVNDVAVATQYEMPEEALRWQPPLPECFICHKHKSFYASMPWGSDYDGEVICGDCCHRYFDPVIKEAKNAPESQD